MQIEAPGPPAPPSTGADERFRHLVQEAAEPIANFWPMKRFVHHNPIHGLEHLPFDRAVREARHLLGGNGYLSNQEYRQLHRSGRITADSVARALGRVGPTTSGPTTIALGTHHLDARDVWRAQLLFGFEPLDPRVLPWTLGAGAALAQGQDDLPPESARRLEQRAAAHGSPASYLQDLWASALDAGHRAPEPVDPGPLDVGLPAQRTVADWIDQLAGAGLVEAINTEMTKWVAAFVDEGMAGWTMPDRSEGLYRAWRALAPLDVSGRLLGITRFAAKVRATPARPDVAILQLLERLGVPEARWAAYLSRHLAQLPGWAGLVRWLGESPDYPGQAGHPVSVDGYLAIRLFYEAELVEAASRRQWGVSGTLPALVAYWTERGDEYAQRMRPDEHHADHDARTASVRAWPLYRLAQHLDLTPDDVRGLSPASIVTVLGWVTAFADEYHGPVWLEAYEDSYRQALLGQLVAARTAEPEVASRPRAQVVLCIDVRSESFRRHIEAQGAYETFGYAGFFGVAMAHEAFDGDERFPLCPVLLQPKHAVDEVVRPEQRAQLESYASGTRWQQLLTHLFHDVKQHPLASLMLVDAVGFFFSAGLLGKTLAPAAYASVTDTVGGWFRHPVGTRLAAQGDARAPGFTLEEQAGIVEGGLRVIGLTERLGRLVVLCGHGSVSDNNPYFGALHCGACGGKHGDANARAFATMANHSEVRGRLAARGLVIPVDTWFLAAKHITTSDRVLFYDVEDLPATHREDLRTLDGDLERAGATQALERCGRMPRAGVSASPDQAYRHVAGRTVDWANVRPEWGLSGNAAFVIGRRRLTQALNLQGRAFLHSYHPAHDPDGAILEKIMTAPLIVGQWINMEHYFSGVDPWFWGSGSKVIHNVVSGVGVMLGSQSDLQTGLPLQTVNNGAVHHHEPMRLLTVIDAPPARISAVIAKHALLQALFHNGWLNLVAVDPTDSTFHRYTTEGVWEALS